MKSMQVSGGVAGFAECKGGLNDAHVWCAAFHAWDQDAGTLHNDACPLQIAFHSYDPVLAVTDDSDNIWYVLAGKA